MPPSSILITGASSGIGAALALCYARPGVTLFLGGRDSQRLEETASGCRNRGAAAFPAIVDVADRSAVKRWIEEANAKTPLDLVIANAGISGGTGGSEDGESGEQARRIFEINLNGVLNTVDPVLPLMKKRRGGQIALMSSLASFSGWAGAPAYSASKGAVRFYGEALRGAMAGTGVKINVICPGFIRTPMTDVNNYRMPFMMDVDKAAGIIAAGLAKDRARICFPFATYALVRVMGALPLRLGSLLMRRMPEKPVINT